MRLYVSKQDIVCLVALTLIVFQDALTRIFPRMSYVDEMLTAILVVLVILNVISTKHFRVNRFDCLTGLAIAIYAVTTMMASYLYRYQSLKMSLSAAFLGLKWFAVFYGVKYLYNKNQFHKYINIPHKILHLIIIALGFIENIYYINNLEGLFNERKYSNLLMPIFLCGISVTMIAFLFIDWNNTKIEWICLFLMIENLVFSTKAKGYGAACLAVAIFIWVVKFRHKIRFRHIIAMGAVIVAVAWKKIYFYYIWGTRNGYSRSVLTTTGFQILKDFFPLGTGWGTFGSNYASKNYSPIYHIYGLAAHPELGINSGVEFSMDSYLATVMGESGFIGLCMIITFIISAFVVINKLYISNINLYAAGMLCISYLVITFVEESGFANPALMGLAIVMGIITSKSEIIMLDSYCESRRYSQNWIVNLKGKYEYKSL